MLLKITLMHEPGEDPAAFFDLPGVARLQYPEQGHLILDCETLQLANDFVDQLSEHAPVDQTPGQGDQGGEPRRIGKKKRN
jgi:hypothetical protein